MILKYIFLCSAGFIAALVDSIAGGGGLISIPAFLFAGLSPYNTLGTNKFSSSFGSATSSYKFIKSKRIDFRSIKYLIPFTLIGAILGVNTVLMINPKFLNGIILIFILFVGLYSLFSKKTGEENNVKEINLSVLIPGAIFALLLGFYDGFFGPGTGSFLIFGLIKIFGFDFINSAGNAKVLNFTSNIASLILFAIKGQIIYSIGIPVAISMIIGARIGTKLALKNGTKLIRPIFILVTLAVGVKLLLTIF